MVLRDNTTADLAIWGGTPERRRYLLQNWRADVTTLVSTQGEPVEWYRYTAYGTPTAHPIADVAMTIGAAARETRETARRIGYHSSSALSTCAARPRRRSAPRAAFVTRSNRSIASRVTAFVHAATSAIDHEP